MLHYIIKDWQPINIISGSEAAKTLKGFKENDIAKAASDLHIYIYI